MRFVAVPWQVFLITRSTVAVGLIGLVELVPLVVFSIFGGAVADVRDRKWIMLLSQIGLLGTSVALVLVSLTDRPSLPAIYAITGLASAINSFDRPARSAMLPNLVSAAQLPAAMALRQVVFQTTTIIGPAIAGLLLAAIDIAWVYAIDAATFLAAIVALRWVPSIVPEQDEEDASYLERMRQGLAFSFGTPFILSIFVIDLVAMITGSPRSVMPALAEQTFDIGASGLGLLYAAPAAGALVAALTTGWVSRVRRQGMAVLVAVTLWGAAITGAGLAVFSLPLTLLLLAVAGGADVVSAIFRGTMLQEATPDGLRGRVSAVNLMVVTGGPRIGDIEAGLVAGVVGAPSSIVIGGAACLAGTAVVAGAFPSLRKYVAPKTEES